MFLSSTIKVDDFTARLFRIYTQVLEEGLAQVPARRPPPVLSVPLHRGGLAWALSAGLLLLGTVPWSARSLQHHNVLGTACDLRTLPCLMVVPFG